MFMEIEAFSGANLGTVQFDLTGDGILNQADYITPENALDPDAVDLIPPAGLLVRGKLQMPAILKIAHAFRNADQFEALEELKDSDYRSSGCSEILYLSSSTGSITTVCEKAVSLGISHWKEVAQADE